jgi:hypothetical protein
MKAEQIKELFAHFEAAASELYSPPDQNVICFN